MFFLTFDLMLLALCKYIHVHYVSYLGNLQLTHKCLLFSNKFFDLDCNISCVLNE